MTDLITAEELLERLARLTHEDTSEGAMIFGDPVSQEDRRQSCLEEIRAFHRNAAQHFFEAAAKAVCGDCKTGAPPIEVAGVLWHRGIVWCKANPIRLLMSETPVPAGQPEARTQEDEHNE